MEKSDDEIAGYIREWAGEIRETIKNPEGNSDVGRELMRAGHIKEKAVQGFDLSLAGVTPEELAGWSKELYRSVVRWAEKNNMIGLLVFQLVAGEFKSPEEAGVTDAKVLAACYHYSAFWRKEEEKGLGGR